MYIDNFSLKDRLLLADIITKHFETSTDKGKSTTAFYQEAENTFGPGTQDVLTQANYIEYYINLPGDWQ